MNKRFVKNNFGLLAVVSVCAVIAAGLLIFTLIEYVQMYDYITRIEGFRTQVEKIIKQKPAPVDDNRALLLHDINLYTKVAKELQQHFGHPMKPAVDKFFAVLRTKKNAFGEDTPEQVTPERFLEEFRKGWDPIDQRDYAQKQYFLNNEFRPKFRNWAQAQREFINAAQPFTFEELTPNNADEVLLSLLGVPRYLNGNSERLGRILAGIRERLLKEIGDKLQLSTAAMGLGIIPGNIGESVSSFSFKSEDFPVILDHIGIVSDLLARIRNTGIRMVYDIRIRRGGDGGGDNKGGDGDGGGDKGGGFQEGIETAGGYRIYHYQIEVSGSMESIRSMVATLDNAFADRRVYIVKSIFLYAEENSAANLFEIGTAKDGEEIKNMNMGEARPEKAVRRRRSRQADEGEDDGGGAVQNDQDFERRRRMEEAIRRYREEQERMPYERRDGYGEVLIGSGDSYRAVIDVEYVAQAGR